MEVEERPRAKIDIDFNSHRVIQCEGELALLDEDEVCLINIFSNLISI